MSNYDLETRGGRAAKTTLLGILALAILIATSLGSLFIGIRYISLDDITLSFTNYRCRYQLCRIRCTDARCYLQSYGKSFYFGD